MSILNTKNSEAGVELTDDIEIKSVESILTATRSDDVKGSQKLYLNYLVLPFVFLTVTLLGGLRFSGIDGSFIFLKPALLYLIFASILTVLYMRSGLVAVNGWFSEDFPMAKNIANGTVLLTLFAATTQLFNSLLPEQGLPFWIVAFCFFWTLWNNLFTDFDTKKLLRSLSALFGLAFVAKYMVLSNLTAPAGEGWLRGMIENPAQSTVTWLLDLPKFSSATGYIQFLTAALYLLGLYLLPETRPKPDPEIIRLSKIHD